MIREEHIKSEALRYMGYKGAPDDVTAGLLDKAYRELEKAVSPKYTYLLCERDTAAALLAGNDINAHIEGCGRLILFAATLGSGADRLIRSAEISNMAYALIMDSAASAYIEEYCDEAENEIKSAVGAVYYTWRYSPGYGDYPISLQNDVISFLKADKLIGLTVTDSHILIPRKSVTAVIGVSDSKINEKRAKSGCESCSMKEKCLYRKGGTTCGRV